MSLPVDWKQSAAAITFGFETSGDPYLMIAGDFDGMGISCGALQWNIGMGSLQPMVKAVGQNVVRAAMPTYGLQLWTASTTSIAKGLTIVRAWQTPDSKGVPKLNATARKELGALMNTPEMRGQQDIKIDSIANTALTMANNWVAARGSGTISKRLYCWMFDLATQNGSLEGQTPQKVDAFISQNTPDRVDDLICDYLAAQLGTGHKADARKNAALWRNNASTEKLELLCLTYLRSQTSVAKWRHVVINRKGTIAMGVGWVNSTARNFSNHGL
jgi:hypothetical protein